MSSIRTLGSALLDFLFPPLCVSCGALLRAATDAICHRCICSIPRLRGDEEELLALRKSLSEAGIAGVYAPFLFEKEGPLQSGIHALKYQNIPDAGRTLGRELGKVLVQQRVVVDLLVPVPLHKARLREREYNQAEAIVEGVASVTGAKVVPDALIRTRHTSTQTKLTADQRKKNVGGAFEVHREREQEIGSKSILLVDDVLTTGATIAACACALMLSGPANVGAAAVAVAQRLGQQ